MPVDTRTIGQFPPRTAILGDDIFVLQADTGLYFHATADQIATFVGAGTSPLTTKGDLFGFDIGEARIPIGTTNGFVLTVDSSEALGLKWAAATGGIASINGETGAAQTIAGTTNRITVVTSTDTQTLDIGTDVVTLAGVQTLTNKSLTVSQITDFATGVSTNAAVVLNTAKVTNATHTGDVTGSVALTIANNAITTVKILNSNVTLAKIQNIATSRFLGRVTAATGVVEELSGTQATTLLDVFTSALQGLVPASGGLSTEFLSADGTFSVPAGSGGDMLLAAVQTVTGAKTFGTIGGAVGKFILAGSTSGSTILNAAAVAGAGTVVLPITGTLATLAGTETLSSKTLTTPTIASFTNATHDHTNAVGGGQLLSTTALSDTANIAYLNTANVFLDFNQTFKDNRILIESPDGLTPITIINLQQTLARNLTIPILTANRNFVVTGEASQITLGTEVTGAITNLSDVTAKTGSGTTVVFDTSPIIVTPTIASFVNSTHNHQAAAGGGTLLSTSALSDTADIAYLNTANIFIAGNKNTFAHSTTTAGLNVAPVAGNPSGQANGDIWLNVTSQQLFARINGVDVDLGAAGGTTPPFVDTTSIVEGSADASKELRFEVDGFTPATVRVITPPDADINLGGLNIANVYTAGARQDFLGLLAGTAGFNAGGIAGNPTTQADGDIWLNTSTNQLFGRINGANVDLGAGAGGEIFVWTADHSMATFKLTAAAGNDVILNAPTGQGVSIEVAATDEYLFNATQADYFTNNIVNVGNLTLSKTGDARILTLQRNEILADDTIIGQIIFEAQDAGTLLEKYARIDAVMESDIVDSEDGSLHFHVAEAGTFNVKYMAFNDASSALIDILKPVNLNAQNLTNIGLLNLKIDNNTAVAELEANHTTPTDAQIVGQVDFVDDSSTGIRRTYGQMRVVIQSAINASEEGELFLSVIDGGTVTDYISLNNTGINDITLLKPVDFSSQNATNAVLITPTIASYVNAGHDHQAAAGGGQLVATLALTATGTKDSTTFLRGDDIWAVPSVGASALNDLTDVTITAAAAANQILIYNAGATAMENKTMSGDASLAASGALTIANNAITTVKILNDNSPCRI